MAWRVQTVRRTLLGDLVARSAAFVVLLALADVLVTTYLDGGARPRGIGVLNLFRLPLGFGVDSFQFLPAAWSQYHETESLADVLSLFLISGLAGLLICAICLALVLPLAWLLSRSGDSQTAARLTDQRRRIYLQVAAVLSLLPSIKRWAEQLGLRPESETGTVVSALIGLALLVALTHFVGRLTSPAVYRVLAVAAPFLLLLAAPAWLGRSFFATVPGGGAGLPNVLLISVDSLRADHLDAYGYFRETGPNIRRLAREGVRFETALAPSSWTLPTHATMLTSMPVRQHQVIDDGLRLSRGATLLAEVFSEAGYRTAGFVSGPYLSAEYGFSQGFETYDDYSTIGQTSTDQQAAVSSPTLARLAGEFIEAQAGGGSRPFFAFVHMFDVHYDYVPPAPYDTMFADPSYNGPIDGTDVEFSDRLNPDMPEADLNQLKALYDGEIRFTDEHIGKLLARLDSLGILNDTVVVVTADHGEEFFEHGQRTHRKSLYDEVLRVPLVIRYPKKLYPGTVVQRPVRLMDIGATVLSLAGVEARRGAWLENRGRLTEAHDLTRLLDPAASPLPDFFAYADLHGSLMAARKSDYKIIVRASGRQTLEAYDLHTDPAERNNLVGPTAQVGDLVEQLSLWLDQPPPAMSAPVYMDEHHLKALRALGYVQ